MVNLSVEGMCLAERERTEKEVWSSARKEWRLGRETCLILTSSFNNFCGEEEEKLKRGVVLPLKNIKMKKTVKPSNFIYLTLFPQLFHAYFQVSMAKKALQEGCLNYQIYNIRNWAIRGQVDDYIYGGGPGMLLKIDCLVKTLAAVYENYGKNCYIVLLSPQGKRFTQKDVKRLIQNENLVFICGHYEGLDERILNYIDEQISVGDFITSGGEIPSLLITETLIRALPGVLSSEVYQNETFQTENSFDFASYTRPVIFDNQEVPPVLLSGNHQKIRAWRKENSLQKSQGQQQSFVNQQKIIPQANKWRLVTVKQKKAKNN